MNLRNREKINRLAELVREYCEITNSGPCDLNKIVAALGGTIERVKPEETDCEAKIQKEAENSFKIILREGSPVNRERFSIAHELGHLFFHMGYMIDPEKWNATSEFKDSVYYRNGNTEEEHEANEFAAALLMPEKEFLEKAEEHFVDGKYFFKTNCRLF